MKTKWGSILAIAITIALGFTDAEAQNGEVINGCVRNFDGRLRVVDAPDECRFGETPLAWSAAGPSGPPGPDGVTAAFAANQTGSFTLADQSGDVVSVDVPAGSYVIHGKLTIAATTRVTALCQLVAPNGDVIDNASQVVHREQIEGISFLTGFETIPLQATLAETDGGTVKLQCSRGIDTGTGDAFSGKLHAIKVNTIN